MAVFLTTRGTTSELEKIINNAIDGVVLISPFIKIPDSLFQNLKAADQRGVKISIVYGKSQLEPETLKRLMELRNAKLYFLENLHAKCYFNEKSMVITSLNLYDSSEENNREMGVLVTKQEDEAVYNDAAKEANMIIFLAVRSDLNTQVTEQEKVRPQEQKVREKPKSIWHRDLSDVFSTFFGKNNGFCIGCRTKIDFDEYRPYCPACYGKWAQNKWQKAKYCHECGQESTTTINKPRCRSCYEKTSK
jgi:phosphatidylserine/phosphatidylglycerophosphate/cardiolipin synthase-like enzyme